MGVKNGRQQLQTRQDGLLCYRLSLAEVLLASLTAGSRVQRSVESEIWKERTGRTATPRLSGPVQHANKGLHVSFPLRGPFLISLFSNKLESLSHHLRFLGYSRAL